MNRPISWMPVVGALILAATACGAASDAAPTGGDAPVAGPAAGMCHQDTPDCIDTVFDPPTGPGAGQDGAVDDTGEDTWDEAVSEAARADARALLGVADNELADSVRVARRGEETMMLTEDYVLGRRTVELDDDGSGRLRVTAVIVELPGGPERFA